MSFETKYKDAKEKLLTDASICKENRKWFKEFLEKEEYKLKRKNKGKLKKNEGKLDEGNYNTLYCFINKLRNVNMWFKNKPGINYTKKDIKRVYDDLEDGIILNKYGKKHEDKGKYYSTVFKSKPFEMIGKADLAREVIEFSSNKEGDVKFIKEPQVRELILIAIKPVHKCLIWLSFDVGENINALLQLRKKDCFRQRNPDNKDPEYRINLRKETLKRTRKARSEITNYPETVQFLDIVLKDKKDTDLVFPFKYSMAKKLLDRAVKITKMKCEPNGDKLTWKDLRSSMACDLLSKGWSRDEVNARLGHKPSSTEIDKYINFLALDRHKPKRKITENSNLKLKEELEETKNSAKLMAKRYEQLMERLEKQELFAKVIKKHLR